MQTQLLLVAESMYKSDWYLQQNNDLKHTLHIAKNFITKNEICVIDWPSNSSDLNPIKNLWQIMKNNVKKRMP